MARLNDKFNQEELYQLSRQLCKMQHSATSQFGTNESESDLLYTIDHLCRVANMFCMVIKQDLDGDVDTGNPSDYIESKFNLAKGTFECYIESR